MLDQERDHALADVCSKLKERIDVPRAETNSHLDVDSGRSKRHTPGSSQ